jgi:hypothetical protein
VTTRHQRRRLGWTLLVPGAALATGAGVLWWLSARVDDEIQGGPAHDPGLRGREARGQLENGLAWACGVAGTDRHRRGPAAGADRRSGGPGVAVGGTW